jgi:hypothetical protein
MKIALSSSSVFLCVLALVPRLALAQATNTCIPPLSSDFVTKYELIEEVAYVETNSSGSVFAASNSFGFAASIILATNLDGTASSAVLSPPDGAQPILMSKTGAGTFAVGLTTDSYSNVAAMYADGTYQFTIFEQTISVTLPTNTTLPNQPNLSNYVAAQSINATEDYTLSWTPFITGGAVDFIGVKFQPRGSGNSFSTPDYGCPGALDGRATSLLIPAGTLTTNTAYTATLEFVKIYTYDTNSIPNSALLAGAEVEMRATVSTFPIAGAPPVLTNASMLPGGVLQFDITTTPGLNYTVQFNQTLANSAGWTPLLTTNASASVTTFATSPASGNPAGYYRVIQQ